MSAPSLAIPAAPSMGHAAAPKRGGVAPDADFAVILDETTPAEAPARTATPARRETEVAAHPAMLPAEDIAAEAIAGTTSVTTEAVVAAPVSLTGPSPIVPTVPDAVDAAGPGASTLAPATEPGSTPSADLVAAQSLPGVEPEGATTPGPEYDAPGPASARTPVLTPTADSAPLSVDLPDLSALEPEQARAAASPTPSAARTSAPSSAAAAPLSVDLPDLAALEPEQARAAASPTPSAALVATAVAPQSPLPARPPTDASASGDAAPAEDAPAAAPDAPLEGRPAPVDTSRVRDVIERAQPACAEARAAPTSDQDGMPSSEAADAAGAAGAAAIPTVSARPAPAVPPAVVPILVSADTAAMTPFGTTTQPTEARPAETAVSAALSTLSHASIETTAQISAQIVRKLEGRSTRFEMALTPEGLGQVDVSLDIDADGKLVARMAFDNPLAATELRGRADELRRQLQDAGFAVADDALSFAERDTSAGQQGGSAFDRRSDPRNARAFGAASRLVADADRMATPAAWIPLALTPDRVDMKV